MERHWVPHEEHAFWPCWLVASTADNVTFKDDNENELVFPAKELPGFPKVSESQLIGVDNICSLEMVDKASLLHTVRVRYSKAMIYTRVARILIAVNPFQSLPLYSLQNMRKYAKAADSTELDPHVYGIGLDAVKNLQSEKRSQAVLISGESGAGKTEATKLVLSFLAEALSSGGQRGLQDQIMQTNPILEAFGNAMTVRNNNSSRFGKWLEISVSPTVKITGCSVTDYLLELTRVCTQEEMERNYHVFFQVLQAREELKDLKCLQPSEYRYLKHAQEKAPGVDDNRGFEELKTAFNELGFSEELQMEIFSVVVGILALGNCEFQDEDDVARLVSKSDVVDAANLLGLEAEELRKALLVKKLIVGKEVTETQRTAAQARFSCDALARLMYGRLFKWLIQKINTTLAGTSQSGSCFFGLLDIAGFESFKRNSLEQLFINLSNEYLQQHFNDNIFKMELEDYKAEELSAASSLTFQDNADIVELLSNKGGVLAMLDEETTLPKGSDSNYLARLLKAHDKHNRFIAPKFTNDLAFGIRHFAGDVTYSCQDFLEKNVDKPPDEAPTLFMTSKLAVLQQVGEKLTQEATESGGGGGGRKKVKTVGAAFRASLTDLVAKLHSAEPHFIRCIKPNVEKVPEKFTSKLVLEQLICSGVMEAVYIRQQGYPSRQPFKVFISRYQGLFSKAMQKRLFGEAGINEDPKCIKAFLDALPQAVEVVGKLKPGEILPGKTKIFAKSHAINFLEKAREIALVGFAVKIQAARRGQVARRLIRECKVIFGELTEWTSLNKLYTSPGPEATAISRLKTLERINSELTKLGELIVKTDPLPAVYPNMSNIRQIQHRMESEVKVLQQLEALKTSLDPIAMEKELVRAKELELPLAGDFEVITQRSQKLKKQVPLVKALQHALEPDDKDMQTLQEVLDAVKNVGLHQHPEEWLVELKGEELSSSAFEVHEQLKAEAKREEIRKKQAAELQDKIEADQKKKKEEAEAAASAAKEAAAKEAAAKEAAAKEEAAKEEAARAEAAKAEEAAKAGAAASEADEVAKAATPAVEQETKRRSTITGMSPEGQDKLKIAVVAAAYEYNMKALQEELARAASEGVSEDIVAEARSLFDDLQSEAGLTRAITKEQKAVQNTEGDTSVSIRRLQNLVAYAQEIGIPDEILREAKRALQGGVRQRARSTVTGEIFDQVDMEELLQDTFGDLTNFPGLKPIGRWRGHRASWVFGFSKTGAEYMLKYSKNDLIGPLTNVNPDDEHLALQAFTMVLGWMGDRPMPECGRLGYAQEVVEIASKSTTLADEIYVQVMKQMTDNPSKLSVINGWKLMDNLCQQVRPSSELTDFLRCFLMRSIHQAQTSGAAEINKLAKQCIADLNSIESPEKTIRREKAQAKMQDVTPVQVILLDNSSRKVFVPEAAKISEVALKVAQKLGIHNQQDFALYQVTDQVGTHRLLPEDADLSTVLKKWQVLKQAKGRSTHFVFKRRLLYVEESLNPGDLVHATLTFHQAMWDYLHYPIAEDVEVMSKIASTIICTQSEFYEQFIEQGKLGDTGMLEQVLPESALKAQRRSRWVEAITEVSQKLRQVLDPDERKLTKMSRCVTLMQDLRLFGAHYFVAKQVSTLPPEKVAVSKAPPAMCIINHDCPTDTYWVCLDPFGIRFLTVDDDSYGFQRGFLFSPEAMERVLCWGAKDADVQFVVQTVDQQNVSLGRIPMTVALSSANAVDIAFAASLIVGDVQRRQKMLRTLSMAAGKRA